VLILEEIISGFSMRGYPEGSDINGASLQPLTAQVRILFILVVVDPRQLNILIRWYSSLETDLLHGKSRV